MTDNLSETTKRRIFQAATPPKLGADYQRFPEVEKQIEECLRLSESEFRAHLAITNRKDEFFLKEQTLACLLCLAHSEKNFQIENPIFERLSASCEKRIKIVLRQDLFDENFIEEAVGDILLQMLKQIFERGEKSYDFWEVDFYKTLNALIYAYRRKYAKKFRATRLFSEMPKDEETNYEDRLIDDEKYADRQERRLVSRKILAEMPKDLRRIFILYYVDEETQKTIAEVFGTTDRTVRNQLKRIETFLDSWRDSPGDFE